VIERHKANKAILDKNTPANPISTITELQTDKLGTTQGLSACDIDNKKKPLKKRIHLLKVMSNGLLLSLCTLLAFEELIL
jgi:hypothetical protein